MSLDHFTDNAGHQKITDELVLFGETWEMIISLLGSPSIGGMDQVLIRLLESEHIEFVDEEIKTLLKNHHIFQLLEYSTKRLRQQLYDDYVAEASYINFMLDRDSLLAKLNEQLSAELGFDNLRELFRYWPIQRNGKNLPHSVHLYRTVIDAFTQKLQTRIYSEIAKMSSSIVIRGSIQKNERIIENTFKDIIKFARSSADDFIKVELANHFSDMEFHCLRAISQPVQYKKLHKALNGLISKDIVVSRDKKEVFINITDSFTIGIMMMGSAISSGKLRKDQWYAFANSFYTIWGYEDDEIMIIAKELFDCTYSKDGVDMKKIIDKRYFKNWKKHRDIFDPATK